MRKWKRKLKKFWDKLFEHEHFTCPRCGSDKIRIGRREKGEWHEGEICYLECETCGYGESIPFDDEREEERFSPSTP